MNVKKYLAGADIDFLVEVVFHEVLHVLLTDNWQVWPTALIKKYSGGDDVVAAHLHLMSIERAVHSSFGNGRHLEAIGEWYRSIGDEYNAAWTAISRENTFREFIAELKDKSQWALRS